MYSVSKNTAYWMEGSGSAMCSVKQCQEDNKEKIEMNKENVK